MVETESGLKLKCLRSDNGGEYIDGGFKEYCAVNSIRMKKTVPGTPQQNGTAERMNRTINEQARSMRLHSGLPQTFWADAVHTAVYLINRGPLVPLEFRLPEAVWRGKEVQLSHLKVFGCVSYVHIDSDARNKLDVKSKKCFFISYGDKEFGFRFWDDQNRKIIRSRNVIFNEKVLYKDRSSVETDMANSDTSPQKSEFIRLEGLPDVTEQNKTQESLQEDSSTSVPPTTQEDAEPSEPIIYARRYSRTVKPPQRFTLLLNYILLTDGGEPLSYEESLQDGNSSEWELVMKDEMSSLLKNKTWELTTLPEGKKAMQNKWVYRVKTEHDGSKRFKARLIVKGFQQKKRIDYFEIFSPVVKLTAIRVVLGIVAAENLHLEQLDVKTAFLHGELEEDIYMQQPKGFAIHGKKNQVCKLKKSLYGLKQALRQWYKKFDNFICSSGYTRCQVDHCCYVKHFDNSYIILLLYVDDMLIAGSSIEEIDKLKQQLSKQFEMKDLGAAKQILGMRIIRDKDKGILKLSQTEYVKKVLSRFSMDNAKPVSTPLGNHFKLSKDQSPKTELECGYMDKIPYASVIGSLMYAMVCTRPDIAHAVGVVS